MSVCLSGSPICATNKDLILISRLVLCLYLNISTCLLVLFSQSRDNASELASSLSAYESSLVYLEQNFHAFMITTEIIYQNYKFDLLRQTNENSHTLINNIIVWLFKCDLLLLLFFLFSFINLERVLGHRLSDQEKRLRSGIKKKELEKWYMKKRSLRSKNPERKHPKMNKLLFI